MCCHSPPGAGSTRVPIVVPNSYKPPAFAPLATNPPSVQFVHNNNPTRHRAAWPSQMSQPLGRLHQITVVCPSNDPNRIPLLKREDLGRAGGGIPLWEVICKLETLCPPPCRLPCSTQGGRPKLIFLVLSCATSIWW